MPRPLIGPAALAARLDDPHTRIVDCRFDLADPEAGRRDYLAGHIPGAVFVDLDRDLAGPITPASGRHPLPSADDLAARLGELGIGNEASVVVYDAGNGAFAARSWWLLRWLGHDDVRLLERGLAGWAAEGHTLESGDVEVDPRRFRPGISRSMTLSTEQVAARMERPSDFTLVDARDRSRFRGEREPIDPVAGHIPGTVNLPFTELLDAEGGFLTREELRHRFASVIGDEANWAVMCGSGVTACHLALAAAVAGLDEPRLYAGSWSEWIRDPQRPVSTGEQ